MEINVTKFVVNELLTDNAMDFSCSQAERGSYAGVGSYKHACDASSVYAIVNEETKKPIIDYFESFGAWDREEMEAWSDEELNGLVLQYLASEYRESGIGEEESSIFKADGEEEYYFYFGM